MITIITLFNREI